MNAAAATTAKKRSNSEGVAEPPAKRSSRDVAAARSSYYGLTPELIGHIARFLPMGNPDMMRLLLRVGPRVAAVVRKMYLTGSEYYLDYCIVEYRRPVVKKKKKSVKDNIGYWMDYNEKAWKKRCLGKKHNGNVHSVMLTPEQFRSLNFFESLYGLITVRPSHATVSEVEKRSMNVLQKLFNNNSFLFLISVGDRDVDDGRYMTEEKCDALVDAAPVSSDGKICVRFMRNGHALFAYPKIILMYDLVDVLRYMIELNIINPDMMIEVVAFDDQRERESLLYLAVVNDSANCFHYLLSLPSTDINAVATSTEMPGFHYIDNIIHVCLRPYVCPSYLKGILANSNVLLDAQGSSGRTAFCKGCTPLVSLMGDQTITKLRLLLEAGADPRIENEDGNSPLSQMDSQINTAQFRQDDDLVIKLKSLRKDVVKRINELNHSGG